MQKPDSLKETQFGGDHYKSMGIEPVQFIEANGINFTLGSAIKYITRHSVKNGAVDLKKAIHFIAMDLERVYGIKLTFSFSDEVQLKPDEPSDEIHGPDDLAVAEIKTPQELVREVYPLACARNHDAYSHYFIDSNMISGKYDWLSAACGSELEAWQSALERIQKLQSTKNSGSEGK